MTLRSRFPAIVSLAIIAGSLLLSSCTAAPPSPSQSTSEAKSSGSLIVGNPRMNQSFEQNDPGNFTISFSPVLDLLVYLSPDAQLMPGIAERWEFSSDGLAQTFYIRKGVKFHDGSDLTGSDVKSSLERVVAPDSTMLDSGAWRNVIDRVELKDEYTVVLRVKKPQFELVGPLLMLSGAGAVLPEKYIKEKGYDEWLRKPIGSGPYKVVSWQPGSRLELEAVEKHWRVTSKVKNVTVLPIPEESTTVAMLKTGELDLATVGPDSVPSLKAAGVRIIEIPTC
ncbi:MAG: ABC transporter substrate-binding protein [Chloroflexi bacterium]|nr:ABC transporter substrate-binding protein [Chloroflexota bacterium]